MILEEKSAGAVIFRKKEIGKEDIQQNRDQRQFLILKYPSGHWDFVKGKMEKDETEHQTTIRETKEETGIVDLEFIDGFKQTIQYSFEHEGTPIHKQVVFFLAQTKTNKIKLSYEHLDSIWMSFEDALKQVTFENARIVLTNANNYLLKTSS